MRSYDGFVNTLSLAPTTPVGGAITSTVRNLTLYRDSTHSLSDRKLQLHFRSAPLPW